MFIDFQWSCDCLTTCVGCENPCFPIKTLAIFFVVVMIIWLFSTIIINNIRALKKQNKQREKK